MAIEAKPAEQRRFAVMGDNMFKIANLLLNNQRICRLLKYQVKDPFNKQYADVDGIDLLHKQILIVPKIYDDSTEKMSYITTVFNDFTVNQLNPEFKVSNVRFDIACPYDEWIMNDTSLRPYLIMQELDILFNEAKLNGIGTLQFWCANTVTFSPWIGGYSMWYSINEFN